MQMVEVCELSQVWVGLVSSVQRPMWVGWNGEGRGGLSFVSARGVDAGQRRMAFSRLSARLTGLAVFVEGLGGARGWERGWITGDCMAGVNARLVRRYAFRGGFG